MIIQLSLKPNQLAAADDQDGWIPDPLRVREIQQPAFPIAVMQHPAHSH
jgi:hypothetical protein